MELVPTNPARLTPDWWLLELGKKLDARNYEIAGYNAYYEGRHNLRFATPKFQEAFGNLFSAFSDNWTQLIVDAPVERLSVQGFRYGEDTAGDKKAWATWQRNDLDAGSEMAHTEAGIYGTSYVLVWPSQDDATSPDITIEHPTECIVALDSGSSRRRLAALKRWLADDGYTYATVYMPDALYKFRSAKKATSLVVHSLENRWEQREVRGERWPLLNPFGVVPLVPLPNKPRLLSGGVSEIKDAIPVQDAINKTLSDMMVTSEFAAAPRRFATGFKPPKGDDGKPLPIEMFINRLVTSSDKDTQFGQFPAADLTQFRSVVEMFVQHLASRTRTPPHYFYLSGNFPSGESIKSAETGLVAKVVRQSIHYGEGWEEAMRLAFMVKGDRKRSQDRASETVWKDPESRTESAHIDAIGKKRQILNIPLEQAWEDAGYTPHQIERMKIQLAEEKDWLPSAPTPTVPVLATPGAEPGASPPGEIPAADAG